MSIGLYFDFHIPLALKQLIEDLLGKKNFDPKNPVTPTDTSVREWYSQPRVSTDPTTEVVTINFKLPLSISEFSTEMLRESCRLEVWYRDRSNNWRQVLDRQRVPLRLDLSSSSAQSWYKYATTVYPIVAKSVQLRITRTPDPDQSGRPYSVGVRNTLIKRNVYERTQGVMNLEDEQDVLGNVVTKNIRDWDAAKAVDGSVGTYWRSSPQPDPEAVVSMYLDVRNADGSPQTIERLYLDPVHTGQHLNIYHSLDETVGTRKLSPIQLMPTEELNTDWRAGRGRWDIGAPAGSRYAFTGYWGPQDRTDAWFGIEWTPDFDAVNGPSSNPVLLRVTPSDPNQQAYAPELRYEPGAGQFVLSFRRTGYPPVIFNAGIGRTFVKDEPLRIVVGWAYNPSRVMIAVVDRNLTPIAMTFSESAALPDLVAFDGEIEFSKFRGLLTATVIKFEAFDDEGVLDSFASNPTVYVSPDPVLPDADGNIPASSLDNAVYAADWTQQAHGVGGVDHSEFAAKTWTPVWKNFIAEKGTLFLPQMISTKYLKLEFTNLTEEPYPVYESGIDVSYKVFPISVQQTSTTGPRVYTGKGLGEGSNLSVNGTKSLNLFSPFQILDAIGRVVTPQYDPVQINVGQGYVTSTIPRGGTSDIQERIRVELSSKQIYRREELNPYIIAQDQYYTTIKGEGLSKLAPYTDIPWQEIYAANPGAIETRQSPGALAVRGTDWWLFPGQELRIPASVMERLTSTSTVTERRATVEHRVRFTTTAVHRYETRTVRRDSAVAYFAGVREIVPFVSSFIFGQDKDLYDFPLYSEDQWLLTNVRHTPSGACTWNGQGEKATLYFALQTRSNFTKMLTEFRDSGLIRSDALWASSDSDQLVPGATTIPATPDGSAWLDSFVDWKDDEIHWGAPRGVVSVNLDGDRRYQGRRVIRFTRVAGAGEAGMRLRQTTNYVPGGLFRLGCVVYKPYGNDNELVLRLVRRGAQAEVIYETLVDVTPGRWVDFTTNLIDIPTGVQDYDIELVLRGNQEDELYLSDLYSEVSHLRYFVRLGGAQAPMHEVTDLRYKNSAQVVSQTPVTEAYVTVQILSEKGFAFGVQMKPDYRQ